jgi:hypothetical protein
MTLSSISRRHGFQVISRVMLERPRDYKQELVDLGCNPDVLGAVTWNHMTHSVDVSGSVHLNDKGLTVLPFQFGKVGRSFDCSDNQLTSLEGAPREVGGDFWCSDNQLTSLEGCPEKVGGNFWCPHNQLTSLDGAPEKVGRSFGCFDNRLTSLEGAPRKIGWSFECSTDSLVDVSALRRHKIKGGICLLGPKADKARVAELLRVQGFKGKIV